MKKIEKKMNQALQDWKAVNLGNTKVEIRGIYAYVYLHGNCICEATKDGEKKFSSPGWKTNTTKSRLNALGAGIRQKNWEWYNMHGTVFVDEF